MEHDYALRNAQLAVEAARRRIRESRELLGLKRYKVCALPPAEAEPVDRAQTADESEGSR